MRSAIPTGSFYAGIGTARKTYASGARARLDSFVQRLGDLIQRLNYFGLVFETKVIV